jgi:zinc transport system substrate-binding protein
MGLVIRSISSREIAIMPSKWKRWLAGAAILIAMGTLLGFLGCHSSGNGDVWGPPGKKRVLASIVPIYCMAANVGGDDVEVRCLLTSHGPHDYQSSPHDARLLGGADLFLANGLGLEGFLHSLVRSAGSSRLIISYAADKIPKDRIIEASGVPHLHGNKMVVHAGHDPHVWLGIEEAKYQVEAVYEALTTVDPPHAANFRRRADAYKKKLDDLKDDYQDLKVPGGLVTFHDSFRYFGRSFGVKIEGTIRDLSGGEIAPAKLAAQAVEFRNKGVKLISVEPQYPRRVAETLAREIGGDVRLVELDPIETGSAAEGRNYYVDPGYYLAKMRENLESLKQAAKP